MKQQLFENVGGNQFKLLTENINGMSRSSLVKEGLRKVFMNAGNVITYKHLQGVGLGYIKDVSEAKKCAIQEARILAKEYGYSDNESQSQFVKTENHEDTSSPEENREVQLAKKIKLSVSLLKKYLVGRVDVESGSGTGATLRTIDECATELLKMHGQK